MFLGIISGHGAGCTIEFNTSLYKKIIKKYGNNYHDGLYPQTLTITSGIEIIEKDGSNINNHEIEKEIKLIKDLIPPKQVTHVTVLCNSINSNNNYKKFLKENYNYLDICNNYKINEKTLILCSEITAKNKLYGDNPLYDYKIVDEIIVDSLLRKNHDKNINKILELATNHTSVLLACTELSYLYDDLSKNRSGVYDSIDLLTTKIIGELTP